MLVWIIFPSSEIVAISIFALYGRSGNKRSYLNEVNFNDKFCETKAEDCQAHSSSYWPNVGVGNIEIFKILTSWQTPGKKKIVLTHQRMVL